MPSRFLERLEPLMRILPEVPRPKRAVTFKEKLVWTALVLTVYLIMAEVPLYPLEAAGQAYTEFFILRLIFASKRGTLAELGISPIVTAGLIFELLVGSKIIQLDLSDPHERALFTGGQKLFAFLFAFLESAAYAFGGMYGPLPLSAKAYIFLQLVAASIIIILLDELVQKGWGLGSGVSLFIAAGVAQQIFWLCFSPYPMDDGLPLGAVNALLVSLASSIRQHSLEPLRRAVLRPHALPDLVALITTIAVFLIIMYLEGVRVEIPVVHARYGGLRAKIPLKFLYVSNVPVILAAALLANLFFVGRLLWVRFGSSNKLVRLLVNYQVVNNTEVLQPCLLYYLSAPRSPAQVAADPLRALIYVILFTAICVFFAVAWVETSGMDPETQAEQLVKAGLQIPGFRKSQRVVASILRRYIPALTILSGLTVGLIASIADMLGCLGSGMGILLLVDILAQYQALIAQERALEMYPTLRRLLGRG